MGQTIYQVDSFTRHPFAGNPAGVCLLTTSRPEDWMQSLAAEMNLSETSFMEATADGFSLRWFTPTQEMNLCGHGTLASAHILWETGVLRRNDPARFQTRSGLLTVRNRGDWLEMDFPAWQSEKTETPEALEKALGTPILEFRRNEQYGMALLESVAALREIKPDFLLLKTLPLDGVFVTARDNGQPYDFQSRVFVPNVGINEDPVTGGAHCMLTPFWSERLGKTDMTAYQCSQRGGMLKVGLRGDRVCLSGQAVTVFSAELREPC